MFISSYSSLCSIPTGLLAVLWTRASPVLGPLLLLSLSLEINSSVFFVCVGYHQLLNHFWCLHGAVLMVSSQSRTSRRFDLIYHFLQILPATLSSTMCHIKRVTIHVTFCLVLFIIPNQLPYYNFLISPSPYSLDQWSFLPGLCSWLLCTRTLPVHPSDVHWNCLANALSSWLRSREHIEPKAVT